MRLLHAMALVTTAFLLTNCALLTTPSATPGLQVDPEYLQACPLDLPSTSESSASALLRNRVESAQVLRTCARNHNALAAEIQQYLKSLTSNND